ncbi:sugar-transfer associated ATP-grasp domain-containing protein [Polaribacter sp. IC073]|uniref:sugar-transfer associated ATP-grasp domain-containing protein n=1 Tax=Polaribacter sp. IC073 TaxID=2508540 RepID=UPI0011BF89B8|nr:sugar-transfer associated ATP-grasp domain-containing protein [Polaribacter sp. IC073]TXD48919.1 AMP-binding protein [Polaribacter sp. IC073]
MIVNIINYLEETVAKFGKKIAIEDNNGTITFLNLREEAIKIASEINLLGVAHNQPIGVFLPKSRKSIISFLGINYSGNFYAPLDIKSPNERLDRIIEKLSPKIIITNLEGEKKLREIKYSGAIINLDKTKLEKEQWAGTGYMYEYQLIMNPKDERVILDDKRQFFKSYEKYVIHTVADLQDLKDNKESIKTLLENPSGKIVFKSSDGKCGAGVKVASAKDFDENSIITYMANNQFDLVEEFIIQHPDLNNLSPSGVNTVRIFTQLDKNNEVVLLGCRQRISVNLPIDNMAAGNLAANIDEHTGKITDAGVYSDITKEEQTIHPITGVPIVGFQVPFWSETLIMVKEAAKLYPQNRSIGWDIVITENGPGFIEGNHDWCKLLWQLPAKKGLKSVLTSYLK